MVKNQMVSRNYECKSLQWDTDFFGVSSARVNLNGIVDESGQKEIMDFCEDFQFVTISNNNNVRENNHWIGKRTESFLVDMNIQYLKILNEKPNFQDDKTYVMSNLSKNEQIVDIARSTFNYSRFFNDHNLAADKAKKIYLQWTISAFEQKNKYFVISMRDGNVAGYILFSVKKGISVIELIAVDKKYQGQYVGKSLIYEMEKFSIEQGIKSIQVGTQVNNISAINFYSVMGFKYRECSSIYHLWDR